MRTFSLSPAPRMEHGAMADAARRGLEPDKVGLAVFAVRGGHELAFGLGNEAIFVAVTGSRSEIEAFANALLEAAREIGRPIDFDPFPVRGAP